MRLNIKTIRYCIPALLFALATPLYTAAQTATSEAGTVTTLEEFRQMALDNNKQLMMSRERVKKAHYQKKEAFAAYFPAFDFTGGYFYNQKNISLLSPNDYLKPINPAMLGELAQKFPALGEALKNPEIAGLAGEALGKVNEVVDITNNTLKKSTTYDIHNVFFGAVTLTQPIYMGGKIVAMNQLTHAAEKAAKAMNIAEAENVIYAVDAAYWMVVSLKAKQRLADSFVNLLDSLSHNVHLMVEEGVATRADALAVDVKLNSAQVDQVKVENGLTLSRMALAQICGLPLDSQFTLADEDKVEPALFAGVAPEGGYDMETVYATRPDLRALGQAVEAAKAQKKVALSSMLPNVALMGSYLFSNPNAFNGFEKKFNGAFSIGAVVRIPLWHWGGNYNKYKAAATDETIRRLELADAKELVDLQVNQASFKTQEAYKTYRMTMTNLAKADENLRTATLAFREGVATSDNVMEAQTAWLKAHSEQIDAMIDVQLCQTYLSKSLGTLYNPGPDAE